MSIHIGAQPGQIAPTILLPGDPKRAKIIAETLLQEAVLFNDVRGMLGFTGQYKGKPVSVMGSGMGIPSISIYANELASEYGVKTMMRVGTCGAFQPDLKIGDIVLAMTASTDSNTNNIRFNGLHYAPCASFHLLKKAYGEAQRRGITPVVGNVISSDTFYYDDPDWWHRLAEYGVLAAEMESTGLYTLAAKYKIDALSLLTVSDSLVTKAAATSAQREKEFLLMAEIALEIAP